MKSGRTWLNPISFTSSLLQLPALLLPFMRFTASPSPPSSPTRHRPESQSESWARSLLPAGSSRGRGMLWDQGLPRFPMGRMGYRLHPLFQSVFAAIGIFHVGQTSLRNQGRVSQGNLAKAFPRYPNLPAAGFPRMFLRWENDTS